jgi:hypothetical protein
MQQAVSWPWCRPIFCVYYFPLKHMLAAWIIIQQIRQINKCFRKITPTFPCPSSFHMYTDYVRSPDYHKLQAQLVWKCFYFHFVQHRSIASVGTATSMEVLIIHSSFSSSVSYYKDMNMNIVVCFVKETGEAQDLLVAMLKTKNTHRRAWANMYHMKDHAGTREYLPFQEWYQVEVQVVLIELTV